MRRFIAWSCGVLSLIWVAAVYFCPAQQRRQALALAARLIAPPVEKTQRTGNPRSRVWANKRSGFYYCPHSKLYGKIKPGVYMSQTEALQSGYGPVLGEPCQ